MPAEAFYPLVGLDGAVLRARASTPLYPSEDPQKVRQALRHLFPDVEPTSVGEELVVETVSLDHFRKLIWKQRILDAARKTLLRSIDASGSRATFHVGKQAACNGHVSFAVERDVPLGNIEIEIEGDDLEATFKGMAPMTLRGHPVSEEKAEKELAKRRAARAVGGEMKVREEEIDAEDLDFDEDLADGEEAA